MIAFSSFTCFRLLRLHSIVTHIFDLFACIQLLRLYSTYTLVFGYHIFKLHYAFTRRQVTQQYVTIRLNVTFGSTSLIKLSLMLTTNLFSKYVDKWSTVDHFIISSDQKGICWYPPSLLTPILRQSPQYRSTWQGLDIKSGHTSHQIESRDKMDNKSNITWETFSL